MAEDEHDPADTGRLRVELETFIPNFITPEHRQHLEELVRDDPFALGGASHLGQMFIPETVTEIKRAYHNEAFDEALERLRQLGARERGFVIASATGLANRSYETAYILRDIIGFQPLNLVSFIPGRLAFYEDFGNRHLILRSGSSGALRRDAG